MAPTTAPDTSRSGFTEFDLATLTEFSAQQIAERQWSRTRLVHGSFADFLAVWTTDGAKAELPDLTITRFKRTGTYALTIGAAVVTTASILDKILPLRDQSRGEAVPLASRS